MTQNPLPFVLAAAALAACTCLQPAPTVEAGASSSQVATTAAQCGASPCVHVVTVDPSAPDCKVTVAPEVMVVSRVRDAQIVWKLAAPAGFRFTDIHFKDEDPAFREKYASRITVASADQFHDKRVAPTEARVVDANTKDGSWLYDVTVSDGKTTCHIDPPIINDI